MLHKIITKKTTGELQSPARILQTIHQLIKEESSRIPQKSSLKKWLQGLKKRRK
jgi:hypothetical protein